MTLRTAEAGGFSSIAHSALGASHMPRVQGTTHAPLAACGSRSTLHQSRRWANLPHSPPTMPREQICRSHPIAMRHQTACRAAVHAPPRFVPVTTRWIGTGLTTLMFSYQYYGHSFCFCLIADGLAQPPMCPGTKLLLRLAVQTFAIGHIAHIP